MGTFSVGCFGDSEQISVTQLAEIDNSPVGDLENSPSDPPAQSEIAVNYIPPARPTWIDRLKAIRAKFALEDTLVIVGTIVDAIVVDEPKLSVDPSMPSTKLMIQISETLCGKTELTVLSFYFPGGIRDDGTGAVGSAYPADIKVGSRLGFLVQKRDGHWILGAERVSMLHPSDESTFMVGGAAVTVGEILEVCK